MAETKNPPVGAATPVARSAAVEKRVAARKLTAAKLASLSAEERLAYKLCQSALNFIDVAQSRIMNGKPIPPSFMAALGTLQQTSGEMLYS